MPSNPLTGKYYNFLSKFYKNISSNQIKWTKGKNANYYSADINHKFTIRISKMVANIAANYFFKMFDDNGVKIFEINSETNGQDTIEVGEKELKVHDMLEEIYQWSQAFSQDTIEKIDIAAKMLDSLGKSVF
ncbi:MAG: hypothetical protein J7K40_10230 [candidate division Zixibacteria bacterium]|nr:hypothetical protein [candidate division Zixibacteria bacterium]